MGTVVCQQGFQSYLESQLNEPRALRLRLSSPNPFALAPKSHLLDAEDNQNRNDNKAPASSAPDSSGWSFLQSLSSKKTSSEKENTYVQRLSSLRALSDQSLALCTENLGSETGSDVTDIGDLFSLDVQTKNLEETSMEKRRKGNVSPNDLPPPLNTMRGFQCIQVKPHREDGRLVMTATNALPRNRCFQADRSNGRLRLSIFKDSDEFLDNEEEIIEQEETEVYEEEIIEQEETEEYEEEEDDDEVMENEIETENVRISRGCVEDDRENRGLPNWESFQVATS